MGMPVFIMAAGAAMRWNGYLNTVKQLAPINQQELLIQRTIRQLKALNVEKIYVITLRDDIINAISDTGVQIITPACFQYLSDSLYSTRSYWSEKNLFLLGDVYFSDECLQTMLTNRNNLQFYGSVKHPSHDCRNKRPEMYGFSFTAAHANKVREALVLNAEMARFRDMGKFLRRHLLNPFILYKKHLKLFIRHNYCTIPPVKLNWLCRKPHRFWRFIRALNSSTLPLYSIAYGKLWGLNLILENTEHNETYAWSLWERNFFTDIDDITRDIDGREDYHELIIKLYFQQPTKNIEVNSEQPKAKYHQNRHRLADLVNA